MTSKKAIGERIKHLRQRNGLSQEDFSKMLSISRVTLSQIEQGERELKQSELTKISELFEIHIDELIHGKKKKIKETTSEKEEDLYYKFKQVVLYILNKCAQKPNIGKTVLNKLLYFADFNFYEKHWESITNVEYVKLPRWPVPKIMELVLPAMEHAQLIKQIDIPYFGYIQNRIIPLVGADLKNFKAEEIKEIDDVIRNYSDKSADWMTARSHGDIPYKTTENLGDIISYWLVHYRDPIYSVSEWEDDDNKL